jgi:polysaccharide deacetylase 2 family uncharacterized protein YibQ
MNKDLRYRVIIGILFFIIIVQAGLIYKLSIKKKPPVLIKAKIAIVLDDWGYNLNNLGVLEKIHQPLTIAILPHLAYSQRIADLAKKINKESILHLPLEPKRKNDYLGWEKATITVDMPDEKIKEILLEALENLKGIKGVSNHMGSLATEDERTMTIIFKELKKRDLYFLDNRVTANSICRKVANKLSLRFISRDIFLDNEKDADYIKRQLKKLKILALKKGEAIGVGHSHPLTLKVLEEEMPKVEKEGYKFVFLSELIK